MKTYPFYIKAVFLLLLAFLVFEGLAYAEFILVPVIFGSLFSILLIPVASKFEKWGAHRTLSSFLCLVIMALVATILVFLLAKQIISFIDNLPKLRYIINIRLADIQTYIEKRTGITPDSQITWLKKQASDGSSLFTGALSSTTSTFATIALIPLYTFFMLFYRDRIFVFFQKVTPDHQHDTVYQIISRIKELVQSYLSGILTVMFIIAIIIGTGLEIIGVPYAIFLGVLAGILNVIPYLGIFSVAALSVVISMVMMSSPGVPLFVFLLFLGTHMLEANIITPNIVGSRVSINTMASLLALVVGAEVWGIMGMIVFIPMLGIIKVVLDNIKELEPYGYLLGMEKTGQHSVTWSGTFKKMRLMISRKKETDQKSNNV